MLEGLEQDDPGGKVPVVEIVPTAPEGTVERVTHTMENNLSLDKETLKLLSNLALAAGFLSIAVSLISWFSKRNYNRDHAERRAIFFGLWVPSLFALSHRLARAADEGEWTALSEEKKGIRQLASDFLEEVGIPERA